jgi:hypothetical protein
VFSKITELPPSKERQTARTRYGFQFLAAAQFGQQADANVWFS